MQSSFVSRALVAAAVAGCVSLLAGQASADAPDASAADPCLEGHRLLEDYAKLYGEPGDAGVEAARGRFRHLIALIPDPEESGHSDDFDSVFEGIEEAVGEGGADGVSYVRDRSWLPWPGTDPARRASACWQREPGVVIYRPTADPDKHPAIVALLVGETPTWGVRPAPFEAAFDLADAYSPPPGSAARQYPILGPTFSGTADSLSAVLRHRVAARPPRAPRPTFSVSSGTATNPGIGELLEKTGPDGGAPDAAPVTYWSATPDDDELLDTMLGYLDARGGHSDRQPCKIVVLSESQTGYGAGIGSSAAGSVCWHGVKFPPNLRALREAYESVSSAAGADAGAPRAPLNATSPPSSDGSEVSGQTAAVHDLELGEVLRELSQKRVRFVGILATDARDVIFVAGRVHEQLPDVQLFTLGSDMRYVHPDNARAMNGLLVAHANQVKMDRSRSWSTSLESETVQNVYLAGRYLLTGARSRGNVTISLVGNGAFWQIGPDGVPRDEGQAIPGAQRAPVSFAFVGVATVLVFAGVVLLVFAPSIARWPWVARRLERMQTVGFLRHRGRLWSLIGPCEHSDLAAQDRLVTASLLSVTLCPPLLMLVSRFARDGDTGHRALTGLAVALAIAVIAAMWWAAYGGWHHADGATRAITVAVTTAALFALGVACGPPREATFNLLSGGSPVVAALIGLAIFALGIWCWRVRLRFLDSHRFGPCDEPTGLFENTRPPIAQALGEDDPAGGTGLVEVERRVLRVIERPWTRFPAVPASIHLLFLASIAGPIWLKPPSTFEPGWRNWLLVAFGCIALLPITGNLSRLLATWISFRRLLGRLATQPGIEALRRLPARLARPLEVQLAVSGSEITDLAYALAALEPLSEVGPALAARYAECKVLLDAELRYEAGVGETALAADTARRRARLVDRMLETSSELSRSGAAHSPAVRALIDDYVASLLAVFLTRYVRHFRLFIPPLIVGSVLSAMMSSLYFLQPSRLITSVIFAWVGGIVLSVFVVYISLDRDPVISAMGKREADAVTWNWSLLRRVVTWGVFPLASLLAAQYPEFAYWISAVFDSVAKGFR